MRGDAAAGAGPCGKAGPPRRQEAYALSRLRYTTASRDERFVRKRKGKQEAEGTCRMHKRHKDAENVFWDSVIKSRFKRY